MLQMLTFCVDDVEMSMMSFALQSYVVQRDQSVPQHKVNIQVSSQLKVTPFYLQISVTRSTITAKTVLTNDRTTKSVKSL